MNTTTLSQRHTLLALQRVQKVRQHCGNSDDRKDYRTLVLALPSMILQHGLAQTGSFYMAKGQKAHLVWADLAAVVQENAAVDDAAARAWFENDILRAPRARYQWLTRRALSAATALKRHVQALLPAEG